MLSCAVLLTSFGGTVRCEPVIGSGSPKITSKVQNSSNNGFLEKHPSLKKFLKVAGITAACYAGVDVLLKSIGELCFVKYCDFLSEHPERINKDLTKVEDQTMDRQQGLDWCWNACLTRALFKQGLKDVNQKSVYKAMGGSRWWVSPWKISRIQGAFYIDKETMAKERPLTSLWLRLTMNPVYLDQINEGVDKLSNGNLSYQTVYVPWHSFEVNTWCKGLAWCFGAPYEATKESRIFTKILQKILIEVRKSNPEAILISLCPFVPNGHAITIEEVNDKQVIFGEPTSGLMLAAPRDKFLGCEKSVIYTENFRELYKNGLPVSFVVKKGQQFSDAGIKAIVEKAIDEVEDEKICNKNRTPESLAV